MKGRRSTDQISPQTRLTRKRSAEELTKAGFQISPASLATLACRGGGPPFCHFGKLALYTWADLLEWAVARCTKPCRSTSERHALGKTRRRGRRPKKPRKSENPELVSDMSDEVSDSAAINRGT